MRFSSFLALATSILLLATPSVTSGDESTGAWSGLPEPTPISIGPLYRLRIYKQLNQGQYLRFYYEPFPQLKKWELNLGNSNKDTSLHLEIALPNVEANWKKEFSLAKKDLIAANKDKANFLSLGALPLNGLTVLLNTGEGDPIPLGSKKLDNRTTYTGNFTFNKSDFSPAEFEQLSNNRSNLGVIVETTYPLSKVDVARASNTMSRYINTQLIEDFDGGDNSKIVVTQNGRQQLISNITESSSWWIGKDIKEDDLARIENTVAKKFDEIKKDERLEDKVWLTSENMRLALSPQSFYRLADQYTKRNEFRKETKKTWIKLQEINEKSGTDREFLDYLKKESTSSRGGSTSGNYMNIFSGSLSGKMDLTESTEKLLKENIKEIKEFRKLLRDEGSFYEKIDDLCEETFVGNEEQKWTDPKDIKLYSIRHEDLSKIYSTEIVRQIGDFETFFATKQWNFPTNKDNKLKRVILKILQADKSFKVDAHKRYQEKRQLIQELYQDGDLIRYEFPEVPFQIKHSGTGLHRPKTNKDGKPIKYEGREYVKVYSYPKELYNWEAELPSFIDPQKCICMDELTPTYPIREVHFKLEYKNNSVVPTAKLFFIHNEAELKSTTKDTYVVFRPVLYYLP